MTRKLDEPVSAFNCKQLARWKFCRNGKTFLIIAAAVVAGDLYNLSP
jgi:hypothetical protein